MHRHSRKWQPEIGVLVHPICVLLAIAVCGCGGPPEIPGGTPGRIHTGGTPLREVHLTLYDAADPQGEAVAFAISDHQGEFQLRKQGTLEGVTLQPGTYRVTLESAGAIYLQWPPAYSDPAKSPLDITWTLEDEILDLDAPEPTNG